MVLYFRGSDYIISQSWRILTWYDRMDNFLMSLGFTKSKADSNLCFKVEGGRLVVLFLYVDDLFLTGENELIVDAKRRLAAEFKMKDLGMMHYFLGMEVWQSMDGIFRSQGRYAVEILNARLQGNGHAYGIEYEATV